MTVLQVSPAAEGDGPGQPAPLTAGQRLAAFAITAVLLAITAVVTRSAESVVAVASSLLFLLGWLESGRPRRSTGEQDER